MKLSAVAHAYAFIAVLTASTPVFSQEFEEGTHDATVITRSGSYTVPVKVANGEVTTVRWLNGDDVRWWMQNCRT